MSAGMDLRPLSLGEILDRTFSLYRRHFLLFIGIAGIPHLIVLAVHLTQTAIITTQNYSTMAAVTTTIAIVLASIVSYVFSQGGTVTAVSDLYLGRPISIFEALRRAGANAFSLVGVLMLNGLAILGGLLLLIIPGIYLACRLLVCVPSALIEQRGPRDSLSRSFALTKDYTINAFVILVLSVVMSYAAQILLVLPFSIPMVIAAGKHADTRIWLALAQVGGTISATLVTPILLIATSVYYYDLRIRKEAFDLQFMMDPNASHTPRSGSVPSILS